jgi:hypothetical protein
MNRNTTFCHGKNCPIKESCQRFNGNNNFKYPVAQFVDSPYGFRDKECKFLIKK